MHELSIAEAIVDVAARHAAGRRVLRVEVKVGHLRQVVPDSLCFAFGLVAQGTALDGAELAIAARAGRWPLSRVRRGERDGGLPSVLRALRGTRCGCARG